MSRGDGFPDLVTPARGWLLNGRLVVMVGLQAPSFFGSF